MRLFLLSLLFYILCAKEYSDNAYSEIIERLQNLTDTHPHIIKWKNSFENVASSLPNVSCGGEDCLFFYLEITNFSQPLERIHKLPALFLVGGFHGDERLGPNIVTELAQYIVDHQNHPVISHFLNNRVILLQPMVNPNGYYDNRREEWHTDGKHIDINRDFNYNQNSKNCLSSKGGRSLVQVFKKYLIRAGVSFHGGDNVFSYPWGSMSHLQNQRSTEAPDNELFTQFSTIITQNTLGNSAFHINNYTIGSMTNTIYPLYGAYEDWAYAAGWESKLTNSDQLLTTCNNVDTEQQGPLQDVARTILFLVEADRDKAPQPYTYGDSDAIDKGLEQWPPRFYKNQSFINTQLITSYGHIPRNIFLSLTLIDLVAPYVILKNSNLTSIEFRIGGCKHVDELRVYEKEWLLFSEDDKAGIWENPFYFFTIPIHENQKIENFEFQIQCDKDFQKQKTPDPKVPPQTFFSQSRMNESYHIEVGNFSIDSEVFSRIYISQKGESLLHFNITNFNRTEIQINTRENQSNSTNETHLEDPSSENDIRNDSTKNQSNTSILNKDMNSEKSDSDVLMMLLFYFAIAIIISFIFYKVCGKYDENDEYQPRAHQHQHAIYNEV